METITQILSAKQLRQKTERIAHQILENHYTADAIVMLGITGGGKLLCEQLVEILEQISGLNILVGSIDMDKHAPLSSKVTLDAAVGTLDNQVVIVVDDVLNSGRTLIHAVKEVIEQDVKMVRTVTMIDRRHRKFPIKADYVGMTLATTLQEHIKVVLTGADAGAYLE